MVELVADVLTAGVRADNGVIGSSSDPLLPCTFVAVDAETVVDVAVAWNMESNVVRLVALSGDRSSESLSPSSSWANDADIHGWTASTH